MGVWRWEMGDGSLEMGADTWEVRCGMGLSC